MQKNVLSVTATKMSVRKRKKKNVKGIGEEKVSLISVLGSHKCGGIKSMVPFENY